MSKDAKPGTWYSHVVGGPHNQGLIISETDGRNVAVAYDAKDAPLLAAAPELLEALKGMLEWARRVKGPNPGMEVADAVRIVAKAEKGA